MKKLLGLLFLIVSLSATAQYSPNPGNYGSQFNRLKPIIAAHLPERDSTQPVDTDSTSTIWFDTVHHQLLVARYGNRYGFSGGSVIDTTSLSNRINNCVPIANMPTYLASYLLSSSFDSMATALGYLKAFVQNSQLAHSSIFFQNSFGVNWNSSGVGTLGNNSGFSLDTSLVSTVGRLLDSIYNVKLLIASNTTGSVDSIRHKVIPPLNVTVGFLKYSTTCSCWSFDSTLYANDSLVVHNAKYSTDSTANAAAIAAKVAYTKYQTDSIANVANLAAKVAYSKYQADSTAQAAINAGKQATLVSTTNIKSINGNSLLGSGDLVISGGGSADRAGNSQYSTNQIDTLNGFTQEISGGKTIADSLRTGGVLPPFIFKTAHMIGTSLTYGFGVDSLNGNRDTTKRFSTLICHFLNFSEINMGLLGSSIQNRTPLPSGGSLLPYIRANLPTKTSNDSIVWLEGGANDANAEAGGSTNFSSANFTLDLDSCLMAINAKGYAYNNIYFSNSSFWFNLTNGQKIQDSLFAAAQSVCTSLGVNFIDAAYHLSQNYTGHWLTIPSVSSGIHSGIEGDLSWARNAAGYFRTLKTMKERSTEVQVRDTLRSTAIIMDAVDTIPTTFGGLVAVDRDQKQIIIPTGLFASTRRPDGQRANNSLYNNGYIDINGEFRTYGQHKVFGTFTSDLINLYGATEYMINSNTAFIGCKNDSLNTLGNVFFGGTLNGIGTSPDAVANEKLNGTSWVTGGFVVSGQSTSFLNSGNSFWASVQSSMCYTGSHNLDGSQFGSKGLPQVNNYNGEFFGTGANAAPTSTLQSWGSFSTNYVAKTSTYTATGTDHTIDCTSGTFTVTLPTAVGIAGREYVVTNSGTGVITIGTTSSQTFTNITGTPTTLTISGQGSYYVKSNGANWVIIGAPLMKNITSLNMYCTSTAPSISAGAGAGTSPTVSVVGSNQDEIVTITTGTLPTLSATVATITFSGSFAYPANTIPVFSAGNSNAALLTGAAAVFMNGIGSTTGYTITAGATALAAATTYIFIVHAGGN